MHQEEQRLTLLAMNFKFMAFHSLTFSHVFADLSFRIQHRKTLRLRYLVRVTITRNYSGSIVKDADFLVQNVSKNSQDSEVQQPLKMEVGIEDCLHIEFEYDKPKYNLKDVVMGKIYFLLVRIKIKHMELAVIRRESSGGGQNSYNESENITKFELMDGAPVKGEVIPIPLCEQHVFGEILSQPCTH